MVEGEEPFDTQYLCQGNRDICEPRTGNEISERWNLTTTGTHWIGTRQGRDSYNEVNLVLGEC